jgi:polysaccharide export outer membrane protein
MKWFHAAFSVALMTTSIAGVAQQPPASQPPGGAPAPAESPAPAKTTPPADASVQASKPASVSEAAAVDPNRYVIGAEDNLQVTVWREPTLSGTIPVRPDGMISLVLVGDLKAAGLTPMQLATDITQRLKKFIQDPSVSVVVLAVNSQRVFLIGEVGHAGPVALTAGMTPLQAIAAAGGLSNFANSKHIYILRGEPGKQQKIPFNYKQALKGDNRETVALRPGDTIVVP